VVSGSEELRRACLESVLEWRFQTPGPSNTEVVIHFQLPRNPSTGEVVLPAFPAEIGAARYVITASPSNDAAVRELKSLQERMQNAGASQEDKAKYEERIAELKAQLDESPETRVVDHEKLEREAAKLRAAIADANTTPEEAAAMKKELAERLADLNNARDEEGQYGVETGYAVLAASRTIRGRLTAIQSERVPQAALETLTPQLGVRLGDMVNEEIAKRVSEIVHRNLGEQFRAVFHPTDNGGVELVIVGPQDGSQ
jgi:hypothetical protein